MHALTIWCKNILFIQLCCFIWRLHFTESIDVSEICNISSVLYNYPFKWPLTFRNSFNPLKKYAFNICALKSRANWKRSLKGAHRLASFLGLFWFLLVCATSCFNQFFLDKFYKLGLSKYLKNFVIIFVAFSLLKAAVILQNTIS